MLRVKENVQNEHMRDLLEEVEDQLSNSLKELNQKSQEAQRYKVPLGQKYPKLGIHFTLIGNLPRIKKYVAERPETQG